MSTEWIYVAENYKNIFSFGFLDTHDNPHMVASELSIKSFLIKDPCEVITFSKKIIIYLRIRWLLTPNIFQNQSASTCVRSFLVLFTITQKTRQKNVHVSTNMCDVKSSFGHKFPKIETKNNYTHSFIHIKLFCIKNSY